MQIKKALTLKAELDKLRPLSRDDEQQIMQKLRLDWNYHSNHIEGNTLTYGETKALILFGITAQGKPLKDHLEVKGHNEAIEWLLEVIKEDRPLTENFICELHQLILKEPYEVRAITPEGNPTTKQVNIGEYKQSPNHVKTATGETFRFATPEETPAKMQDLINWYRNEIAKDEVSPILLASQFHYKFIRIHPFDDGNGRTARILMNFILMTFGYPPVIIKTQDKANYYAVLRQADADIFEPFVEYIAQNLNHSLEIMLKGARGESIEDPNDLEKEIALLEHKINSLGEVIKNEVVKDENTLNDIYDNSLAKLILKFVDKCETFDKLYLKTSIFVKGGNTTNLLSKDNMISILRQRVDKLEYFDFNYKYQNSKNENFPRFSFVSGFRFYLRKKKYTVKPVYGKNFLIQKSYTEQLTEKEINQLVDSEVQRHKAFIEEQIKKVEEEKKK